MPALCDVQDLLRRFTHDVNGCMAFKAGDPSLVGVKIHRQTMELDTWWLMLLGRRLVSVVHVPVPRMSVQRVGRPEESLIASMVGRPLEDVLEDILLRHVKPTDCQVDVSFHPAGNALVTSQLLQLGPSVVT